MPNTHRPSTPAPLSERIGTLSWLQRTQGRLSLKDKLRLMQRALAPTMAAITVGRWASIAPQAPMGMSALQHALPDTPAVARCLEAMMDTGSTDLLQHSWRTYWWGAAFAHAEGIVHDHELLLVASLMHDFGVADHEGAARSGCACFTAHSAQAAMGIAGQCQWGHERVLSLGDAITMHMNGIVPLAHGAEAHLLQRGAACDVIGAQWWVLQRAYRDQVVQAHPRGQFDQTFRAFLRQELRRHPGSRAAFMTQLGLPLMIRMNPF